jgi:recombination endonuclease VII
MTKKQRDQYLKRKYGIGLKEYNRMFKAQGGKCAVCRRPPKPGKNLHVDHDHASNEARGLLDYYCNRRVIGRNTEKTVRQLVAYLMPHYDLVLNNSDVHLLETQTRHVMCNCLVCVREEVNAKNPLLKSRT